MSLLTNPILLRAALLLVAAIVAFFMGAVLIRRMRRSLTEDPAHENHTESANVLPVRAYNEVIQQLKQQKHELLSEQSAERRRARTSENISAAVLANLSSGVLFFTTNGLVRQSNAAAKQILGFGSLSGMSLAEIFRDAALIPPSSETLAETLQSSLRGNVPYNRLEARYLTPTASERILDVTVSTVQGASGEVLGGTCLLNDQTALMEIRRQIELRGEMSAEMALALRNSLATISGYGQQLAATRDPELARQLASDIAAEAAHLDHTIGGFLAEAKNAKAAKA